MKETGILAISAGRPARRWEDGCKDLGFQAPLPIIESEPSAEALKRFFAQSPSWLYLSGHFAGMDLYNNPNTIRITFRADGVVVRMREEEFTLAKAAGDFALHNNCEVVVWGGCSVCASREQMGTLRSLFGNHLLLGYSGRTGWKITDAMLGGGFIKEGLHFFSRVKGHTDDWTAVRDAWMKTAKFGYGGGDLEYLFRAIDPDGQEWLLRENKVVRGRKVE